MNKSEQAVIGAVLLDPSAFPVARAILSERSFARSDHRRIWREFERLVADGTPIDVVNVAEALDSGGALEDVGGLGYLGDLAGNTPGAANIEHYAAAVAHDAYRRMCAAELQAAQDRIEHDDPKLVVAELTTKLLAVQNDARRSLGMLDLIEMGFREVTGKGGSGDLLPTGITPLDLPIGGLESGRLYVIAARTGAGKSALALSMAHNLTEGGFSVGFCSLEMPAKEIINRLFANRYGLNLSALTRRLGSIARELDCLYQGRPMSALKLQVDDETVDLSGLLARANEWHYQHGIRVLFVDYIGLIQVPGKAPRHEKIGEASRALKQLAKRLGIAVIVACQFNRDADKDDRRPRLSDLRDSGSIEQDADAVIAVNPLSDADDAGCRLLEIGLLKNRSGPTGWIRDSITFDGRHQSFLTSPQDLS